MKRAVIISAFKREISFRNNIYFKVVKMASPRCQTFIRKQNCFDLEIEVKIDSLKVILGQTVFFAF